MSEAKNFMLAPKDTGDDLKFLAEARQGCKIEPLIDGERFFAAIEEAIADAKETVYCTFWSIYPDAPLVSKKAQAALKAKDWLGMLIGVATLKKVKVRILLSDFDPRVDNNHHQRRAWNAYNKFVAAALKAGLNQDQFQVMVSLHPAVISDMIARRISKPRLQSTIDEFNKNGLKGLENSPGIWGDVTLSGKTLKMAASPTLDVFPASHHQKTVIVDHQIGFLGGGNISDYFLDNPQHVKKEPAHEIWCRVEGPVVADLERNLVGRWNAETAAFNTFVSTANTRGKALGKFRLDDRLPISALKVPNPPGKAGNAVAQLLRTQSNAITGSFGTYAVQVVRDDIARSYEQAVSAASEYIYVENQVLRMGSLADAIIKRFSANKQLQVIIVLPVLPEEIADGTADQITMHGQALQHEALTKLRKALGPNLGLYSLLQKKKSTAKLTFFDSVQIDVHCKILVVDDAFATIGSANASPRSFMLDSEINIGWYEPATVKKFREDLWREHLETSAFATWKPAGYVKEWDAIAGKNVKAKPELRQGFVVPHDPDRERGTKAFGIPDFLADAGHPGETGGVETAIA